MAAGWVQLRCRECAAEVAATAKVCSRCGTPIAGQPPVVADTAVADTVVGAVSAAGEGVPAGVAGQALPEPFVPGSGDSLPAELRLVLGRYIGLVCGLFAVALACATVFAVLSLWITLPNFSLPVADDIYIANDMQGMLFGLSFAALWCGAGAGAWVGAVKGVQALKARIRFSSLLRQPSDPRTATVTASKRGGRTLILDTTPGGYQPLSEVRLALWTKAEMLLPGERVTVHGRPGGKNPLLVSSAQRGRAFLGTETSRSTIPAGPLDEKVSGAALVDWAAWAASTTFSSTGLKSGYDKQEVDAFRCAVRDTFLGGAVFWVSTPPVRSDELRGRQFSTHWRGYDKTQVAAFVEAAGLRLAAMESTDRPVGPLVSSAILAGWAEWADSTTFSKGGYTATVVDPFRRAIRDTFRGVSEPPVTSDDVHGKQFPSTDSPGYDKTQVHAFLEAAGIRLAAMESTDRPEEPLVSSAVLAEWARWADSMRFSTTRRLRERYATAEVDAFREELRDTFLGVRQPPLTWHAVHSKRFTVTFLRPGYDVNQVDAFFDDAEVRLAEMQRSDKRGRCPRRSEPEPAPWGAPAEKSPPEPDTAEEAPAWEPAPWGAAAEKARLVGLAEWAASTTFSSTRLKSGYDKQEVDALRCAVRDTFLGVSKPAVRSHDLRGKQFSTHRPGYDKTQVAAFLDAAGIRLAAMESTDRPAGPLVSGARLVLWAEWADSTTFGWGGGYEPIEVDNYRRAIRDTFLGVCKPPVRSYDLRGKQFASTDNVSDPGYDMTEVDAFIEKAAWRLAATESTDRPAITW